MRRVLLSSWVAFRHSPCHARKVVSLVQNRSVHTSRNLSDVARKAFVVDAIVEDVNAGLQSWPKDQAHVYVGTGQYSSEAGMERVVVASMLGSPHMVNARASGTLTSQQVLFDGFLAAEDVDSLEDRLSRLCCSMHVGEVDALRSNAPRLAFTPSPDVTVFPLACGGPCPDSDVWQWISCTGGNLVVCRLGGAGASATGVQGSASEPPGGDETRVNLASIADFRVRVEEVEWSFAELQVCLTSGEVVTLLRTRLDGIMEQLIDTDAHDVNAEGSCDGQEKSSPGHSESAIKEDEEENIFNDDLSMEEIRSVDFAAGRVHPELAVVMCTEWLVKLAAQLCLSCRMSKHPVGLRLPRVLRADSNKWVELRNELWMTSRRAPVM